MSEWISVEDEMPTDKIAQPVIVTDGHSVESAVFYHGEFACLMTVRTVTHWMPLPEPPK